MFRLWGRIFEKNRLIRDVIISDDSSDSLDSNIREFQVCSKTRFHADHFIEQIDFDYLEISILEED